MTTYDPLVVFDDVPVEVLGAHGVDVDHVPHALVDTGRAITRRVRAQRLHVPQDVVVGNAWSRNFSVLGLDSEQTGLPLYDDLESRFAAALPQPKLVRLDDASSYEEFRRERRQPYLENLSRRLAALEATVAAHVADHHGERLDELEEAFNEHVAEGHSHVEAAGDEVVGAIGRAVCGGEHVALPIPEVQQGKVHCWQDGPEVLLTICFLDRRGKPRMATTGEQLAPTAATVLGSSVDVGADPEDTLMIAPRLSQILCGERLLSEICGALPDLFACAKGDNVVGALVPRSSPSVAAAMALLQRCQRGDRHACAEVKHLQRLRGEKFLAHAAKLLLAGQKLKARG